MISAVAAHPRSRGEHCQHAVDCPRLGGSSPLARGTHNHICRWCSQGRLIPARAGNTTTCGAFQVAYTAHPRSRGEHPSNRMLTTAPAGSSPLARGTRVFSPWTRTRPRLIPARAGNTCSGRYRRRSASAHPRSRGEHVFGSIPQAVSFGSSPLARGTLTTLQPKPTTARLIPARAGNTFD